MRLAGRPKDGRASGSRNEATSTVSRGLARRRREVPWIVFGVCLAAASALGFAVVLTNVGGQHQVLASARAIPAGHVITAGDLAQVTISSTGLDLLSTAEEGHVLGHAASVPIAAGAVLVRGDLGPADTPAGRAVVAVLCKPGQYPPALAAGQHVRIVPGGDSSGAGSAAPPPNVPASLIDGLVIGVDAPSSSSGVTGAVITLSVSSADAAAVAQSGAAGRVSLIVVPAQG